MKSGHAQAMCSKPYTSTGHLTPFHLKHLEQEIYASFFATFYACTNHRLTVMGIQSASFYAGTLSAWYIWGALGLYPLAATKLYFVGSPCVEKATIHLHNGECVGTIMMGQ